MISRLSATWGLFIDLVLPLAGPALSLLVVYLIWIAWNSRRP